MKLDALDEKRETQAVHRGLDGNVRSVVERAREDLADAPETASLAVFSRVRGFLRKIVLDVIGDYVVEGVIRPRPEWDKKIWGEFSVLARRLGVFEPGEWGGEARLRPSYALAMASGQLPDQVSEDREDYFFMVHFAEKARADGASAWMQRDDVAYFPWMIDYFREIEEIDFTGRGPIRQGTAFCSDLGEMAFVRFTHETFRALLDVLRPGVFVDVGCGEGRHVAAASAHPATRRVLGVEKDPVVAASARERLAGENGEIITGDIRDCHVAEPVDMVFACYMLFYLDEAEQLEALRKIHGMLAPDGVLVFCQYFPDFEEYQDIFVGEVTEGVSSARYVAEVARACVDAEVLLNRILAHFRSPVYWAGLQKMLRRVDFRVREILPADPLFYSFYVIVEKGRTSHDQEKH